MNATSGPNRQAQERFQIFSNIRGVIRIRNRLPGDEYTRESIRIPLVRQFWQTYITCPQGVKVTYSRFLEWQTL
jgi:hypothetical protein